MKLHEQRVIDEKTELDIKLEKLKAFPETSIFKALPADERDRLGKQAMAMQDYSDILAERIAAFPR